MGDFGVDVMPANNTSNKINSASKQLNNQNSHINHNNQTIPDMVVDSELKQENVHLESEPLEAPDNE